MYNPNVHHRRSIRLKGYDYSQAGLYFITINIRHHRCLFGTIEQHKMILNEFGIIACQQWEILPNRYANLILDVFQIMPNHMHGILLLTDAAPAGAGLAPAHLQQNNEAGASPAPTKTKTETIANIVGAYKSQVANLCLEIFKQKNPGKAMGKLWQRNYYDHIIRNDTSFLRIANYITSNPGNWKGDRFYNE